MKKNALGKILVAAVAALVLSFGLVACGGGSADGNAAGGDDSANEAADSSDAGVDPLMEYDADGNLKGAGTWNYSDEYVMASVYGDAPQTNTAIQLVCENGTFTCEQPDKGITPFLDEWERFMGEGTYTYEYKDGVPVVTFELNGSTATVEIDLDYGEMVVPATLFDADGTGEDADGNSHADMELTFVQY